MFGCVSPAAACASRRKRSRNSGSSAKRAAEQLQRDPAAEHLVLGAPDLGHAARAEPLERPVAAVDDRVARDRVHLLPQRLEDALGDRGGDGAALALLAVDHTATATSSVKPMNQRSLMPLRDVDLGRAGLAGQLDALRAPPRCPCPP